MVVNINSIKLYAETHAIEVVNFSVHLGIPIQASDISRFDERIENLRELFPAINDVEGIRIQVTPDNGQVSTTIPPIAKELMYFDADGQPIWVGNFQDNLVMVSCRKYSTWEKIWPEAKHRLKALLDCVDDYKPIHSIDYSVTDTFHANKSEEILFARNPFRDSQFVPLNLVHHSDPRWDISQGWFDSTDNLNQILVRVDAKSGIINKRVVASISNLHSQIFSKQMSVSEISRNNQNPLGIEQVFSKFHDKNKDLLKQNLIDDLLIRMRLKAPD